MTLGVDGYRGVGALGDGPDWLSLARTLDEQEVLAEDIARRVAEEIQREV